MNDMVVLVDENDIHTGLMPKLEAHEQGLLHRAFSVFLFNTRGEMLLQKRAADKYHSAGLWSNACCSHPRPGERTADAAKRRLAEEMGMSCELTEVFCFIYKAALENNLTEYEFDHVFAGVTDNVPAPDDAEVADWRYMNMADLETALANNPQEYTAWFKLCMRDHKTELNNSIIKS
jgi:isopentenyl-diphosphate Delta-isomerase